MLSCSRFEAIEPVPVAAVPAQVRPGFLGERDQSACRRRPRPPRPPPRGARMRTRGSSRASSSGLAGPACGRDSCRASDCSVSSSAPADLFRRLERAAAGEDGELREKPLLVRSRRPWLHSIVARRVRWRGSRRAPPVSRRAAGSSRSRSCAGESAVRAAASSSASGSSSRRRQISCTARPARSPGSTARARAKRAPTPSSGERRDRVLLLAGEAEALTARDEHLELGAGGRGGPRGLWPREEVLEVVEETSSIRWSPTCSARPLVEPSVCAAARGRGSDRERRERHPEHAVGKALRRAAAACSASRVLPVPPGPVT